MARRHMATQHTRTQFIFSRVVLFNFSYTYSYNYVRIHTTYVYAYRIPNTTNSNICMYSSLYYANTDTIQKIKMWYFAGISRVHVRTDLRVISSCENQFLYWMGSESCGAHRDVSDFLPETSAVIPSHVPFQPKLLCMQVTIVYRRGSFFLLSIDLPVILGISHVQIL